MTNPIANIGRHGDLLPMGPPFVPSSPWGSGVPLYQVLPRWYSTVWAETRRQVLDGVELPTSAIVGEIPILLRSA